MLRLCRRRILKAFATALLPILSSDALSTSLSDPTVAEALPLSDASVDAVVGTLVLCSVKDVDATLREIRRVLKKNGVYLFFEHVAAEDGTILRLVQGFLDPLQQSVAYGCHFTRRTGKCIAEAGFSKIDISMGFLSSASLINPHVYGVARK